MDLEEELNQFEQVDLSDENGIDTSFADQFLKAFTRMAKTQMKTQQSVSFSVDQVESHLEEHKELVDDLKRQRNEANERNEQLVRFTLEVVDLITKFRETAESSDNSEMQSVARTMTEALEKHMDKIGLQHIPALEEIPDSVYHFVVDTTKVDESAKRDRIVEVVRPGYTLGGEVIRKADVIVGK